MLEKTLYHSFLRISVCVLALVLVFDSGFLMRSTAEMSNLTTQHMANVVGVTVGVSPTEINQLTGRITELETELKAKERLISVSVGQNSDNTADKSTFILSGILFILLVLIVLNYALDFMRDRKLKPQPYEESTSQVA